MHALEGILGGRAADGVRAWERRTGRGIEPAEPCWQTAGYTGARLVSVVVTSPGQAPIRAVLKWTPAGDAAGEARAHAAALDGAPVAFRRAHLVELVEGGVFATPGGGVGLLQHIAGGSLDRLRPARDLPDDALARTCAQVAGANLAAWGVHRHATMTALDFVRAELDGSAIGTGVLGPGRLAVPRSPWLVIDGDGVVANPLSLAAGGLAGTRMTFLTGPVHGDLHTGNVLVPLDGGSAAPQRYRLVDYPGYRPDGPLSRDVATLLMSAVVPWFARLGDEQREWMLRYLVAPGDAARAYLPPLVPALIDGVHSAAAGPFAPGGWQDTWHDQLQLSVCAAAVLHSGLAALPAATRWSCFRLAAGLLTDFLRRRHAGPPAGTRGIPPLGPDAVIAAGPEAGPNAKASPGTGPETKAGPETKTGPEARAGRHGQRRLPIQALADIADALLEYPEIVSDSARHQLIATMPAEVRGGVPYSATPRLHVINLIRTCADHPDGRRLLLDLIEVAGGPEARHRRLRDSVERWWAG